MYYKHCPKFYKIKKKNLILKHTITCIPILSILLLYSSMFACQQELSGKMYKYQLNWNRTSQRFDESTITVVSLRRLQTKLLEIRDMFKQLHFHSTLRLLPHDPGILGWLHISPDSVLASTEQIPLVSHEYQHR